MQDYRSSRLRSDRQNCVSAMPRKRSIKLRCPTCKKLVKNTDSEFPFCSERCRLIDLGKWASGGYVILFSGLGDSDALEGEGSFIPKNRGGGPHDRRPGDLASRLRDYLRHQKLSHTHRSLIPTCHT